MKTETAICIGEDMKREEIIELLNLDGDEMKRLFKKAMEAKEKSHGRKVFLRGLIEFSNYCAKNCFYCGIRAGNKNVNRYALTDEQVLDAAKFAYKHNFGSIVIQGGEMASCNFTARIEYLLKHIKSLSNDELGITLSLGEQSYQTYKRWFEAGAHRYLLRIESSNRDLYYRLHPNNKLHSFENRLECIDALQKIGYQTGTGVMIGLPNQTVEDLANDLLFIKNRNIDMVGMGPYLVHKETPMYEERNNIPSEKERFEMTLKMIAVLRIMMPDINMAATTAMQTLSKNGREKAILAGANILMPNITPERFRESYALYEKKPGINQNPKDALNYVKYRVAEVDHKVALREWGDSKHYLNRF